MPSGPTQCKFRIYYFLLLNETETFRTFQIIPPPKKQTNNSGLEVIATCLRTTLSQRGVKYESN